MKLSEKKSGSFTPHPETDSPVRSVIVDVTPLKQRSTDYGMKDEFRIVYESEAKDDDGTRFCIWSRGYTPSLNEKAALRKDLKKLLGRDLTAQELEEFDTESLIGLGAKLMIEHTHSTDGSQTYANIAMMRPDAEPIAPSGKYIRVKDRESKPGAGGGAAGGKDAAYKSAPDSGEAREPWQKCKVHVGKHKGVDLGDLDEEAVKALIEKWLPNVGKDGKATADDKRLKAALEEVKSLLEGTGGEEDPGF